MLQWGWGNLVISAWSSHAVCEHSSPRMNIMRQNALLLPRSRAFWHWRKDEGIFFQEEEGHFTIKQHNDQHDFFFITSKKQKNERDLLYLLGYYQMDLDPQNRFSVVSSSQVLETSPSAELLEKSRHSYYVCYIKLFSSIAISHIKYKLKTFYILSV